MEHYDGPAFYRIQKLKKSNKVSPKKVNKKKSSSLHSSGYAQKGGKHKNFSGPKIPFSSRPFRPSYIPPSVLNWGQAKRKQDHFTYVRLCQELHKEADTYYLFGGDLDDGLTEIDLSKGAQSDQYAEKNQTISAVQSGKVSDVLERADSLLPTETFFPSHETETRSYTSFSNNECAQEVTSSKDDFSDLSGLGDTHKQLVGKKILPTDESSHNRGDKDDPQKISEIDSTIAEPQSKKQGLTGTNRTREHFASEVSGTDDRAEIKADAQNPGRKFNSKLENKGRPGNHLGKGRALNRSFADILNFEHNDQRNLSLFKDPNRTNKESETLNDDSQNSGQNYHFPDLTLLSEPIVQDDPQLEDWVLSEADVLNETLQAFHVDGTVKDWTIGPTVTQFEITLGRGVKVNKVTNLTDDLKLALAAKDIRIEAPIPGKSSIGVEIPNKTSRPVMLREVLQSNAFQTARSPLTVALGVDLFGRPQITNLKKMPHGLIAGATGSGKSVFINSLLVSLLFKAKPSEVKLILIDPKAVEMAPYQDVPHLLAPVISDPKSAAATLKWVVKEMDQRYERLAASGARNIDSFNEKASAAGDFGLKMPYIVIVIDELADLMMVAASDVQDYIARITAKARAAGIHLLIATQRPSVDVVTGTIKNNIPTRVAFMVASQVDSRTILDSAGAERLLGKGDMLYLGNGASQPLRLQGTFIDKEVDRITDFVRMQGKPQYAFDPDGLKEKEVEAENEDEILPEVLRYIVNEDTVSTSKLQRVFAIGYNRAASIVESLEANQYISKAKGSKPRDVFLTPERLAKLR